MNNKATIDKIKYQLKINYIFLLFTAIMWGVCIYTGYSKSTLTFLIFDTIVLLIHNVYLQTRKHTLKS